MQGRGAYTYWEARDHAANELPTQKCAIVLTSNVPRISLSDSSNRLRHAQHPALFTSISTSPICACTCRAAVMTSSGFVTSQRYECDTPPFERMMSAVSSAPSCNTNTFEPVPSPSAGKVAACLK